MAPLLKYGLSALLAWLWTWRHVSWDWTHDPIYQAGWLSPVLAFILYRDRLTNGFQFEAPVASTRTRWILGGGWIFFASGEVLRVYQPEWHLAGILLGLGAAALLWVFMGGFRPHPGPAVLVLLGFGIPWPSLMEGMLIEGDRWKTAALVAEGLNLAGIPALSHGSTIQLRGAWVGLDEACGGGATLLTLLMLACFLAGMKQWTLGRCLVLMGMATALAWVTNAARVLALALLEVRSPGGISVMQHDVVGTLAPLIALGFLLGSARLLHRDSKASFPSTTNPVPHDLGKLGWVPSLAIIGIIVLAGWTLDIRQARHKAWAFQQPRWTALESVGQELAPLERRLLQCDQGRRMEQSLGSGGHAELVHLFWTPSKRSKGRDSIHRPEVCLGSMGWQMVETSNVETVAWPQPGTPIRIWKFTQGESLLTVLSWEWRREEEPIGYLDWLPLPPAPVGRELVYLYVLHAQGQDPREDISEGVDWMKTVMKSRSLPVGS